MGIESAKRSRKYGMLLATVTAQLCPIGARQNDFVKNQIVLPDGTTITLEFPPGVLRLAQEVIVEFWGQDNQEDRD